MGGALNRDIGWERDPGREATRGQPSWSRGGSLCRYVYLCVSLSQSAFYSHTLVLLNTPASGVCLHPFNGLQVYTLHSAVACFACSLIVSFMFLFFMQKSSRTFPETRIFWQVNKHFSFVDFVGAKFPLQQRNPPQTTPTSGVKRACFSFNLSHQ